MKKSNCIRKQIGSRECHLLFLKDCILPGDHFQQEEIQYYYTTLKSLKFLFWFLWWWWWWCFSLFFPAKKKKKKKLLRLQRGKRNREMRNRPSSCQHNVLANLKLIVVHNVLYIIWKVQKVQFLGMKKKFGLWLKLSKFGVVTLELIINHHDFNIIRALFSR